MAGNINNEGLNRPLPDHSLFKALAEQFSLVRLNGKDPSTAEGTGWTDYCNKKRKYSEIPFKPHENAGICGGPASGVIAVDIDNPDLFESFCKRHGWNMPVTRTHGSRKGFHALYQYPKNGKVYGCKAKPVLGLDIKGNGGQVVAPGSIHPESGTRYTIVTDMEPAELPACILELYAKDRPEWAKVDIEKLRIPEKVKRYVHEHIEVGDRSDAMWAVLNALAKVGLSDDQIFYVFYTFEIGQKFKAINGNRDEWLKKQIDKARIQAKAQPDTWEKERQANPLKLPPMPKTFTAFELEGRTFKMPDWIVQGILPEGTTLLGGKPKIGKSFMVTNLALACACGSRALGKVEVGKRGVLYLALEDRPSRLQNRMAALYQSDCWPENLHFVNEWPRIDEGGIPLLQAWLEDHKDVSLVIVDTLATMRSRKGSNKQLYDQDYQTISAFKSLADMMGISIIVIHHLRKMTSEDPLDCLSGTTGLVGAADTGLILQRRAGTTVLYVRGRDIEEQELALKRESTGDWTLLGDAQIAIMSQERAAILKVFQTHKLQVLSLKFLSDATGRKKPSILYHITKLVESGLVSRVEEGKYILERTEPTERIERVERVERVEWSES